MSYRSLITTLLIVLVASLALIGCDTAEKTSEEETTEATTEEAEEIIELTFAFQPQENPEGLQLDTERFADFIAQETGYEAKVFLPTNYSAVVEALRSENADIAYFSGLPYLRASEMANVELLVVEERDGNPFYYSQWFVLEDSDIETLANLEDRTIAFTSPTSTSGFLFPLAEVIGEGLIEQGGDPKLFFGEIIYAGGYEQALLALANGRVEAAAASDYALQQYLTDEQRSTIRVLHRQGPVPTHGLAIRSDLPQEVKDNVRAALLKLNEEENAELLSSVYGAERLVVREHDEYVQALSRARDLVDIDSTL